jgi:hypothetical protein
MKEVAGYILEPKIMANGSESSLHTLAAAFAIVFAIGLFALHLFKFPMDATILDTQYQVESSRAQTIFYQTLLGLFAVICAAVLLWPNAKIIPRVGWAGVHCCCSGFDLFTCALV